MPRKTRIDALGALHPIVCRGIEQTEIFRDNTDRDGFVARLGRVFSMQPVQVLSSTKQPQLVKARSLLCYWAIKELEMHGAEVARRLNVSNSTLSRSVTRGEKIATDMRLKRLEN